MLQKAIDIKYLLWILRAVSIGYDFTKFEPECCQNINRNLFVLGMPQQMSIERLQPFDGRPPSVNWDHVVHVVTMSIWGCECRWDHVVCRSLDFDRQGFTENDLNRQICTKNNVFSYKFQQKFDFSIKNFSRERTKRTIGAHRDSPTETWKSSLYDERNTWWLDFRP